jgi:crossover junction endodeoxyribonuclease RuvC
MNVYVFFEGGVSVIILGIDPGFAIVGWGVLECVKGKFRVLGYGSITTPAKTPIENRLNQIYEGMNTIIDKYKPEVMSIEELFWNTNQKTGICVAEARGTILLAAHRKGLKIFEYTPLQVKQAVVGYGRAEKKQVITMVTTLLNLPKPPKPDDTADALALAICHGHAGSNVLSKYYKM